MSQLSKASLLNAAAAATLLLVSWMLAIVSAEETTSISPARSPVARQAYGTILHKMYRKTKIKLEHGEHGQHRLSGKKKRKEEREEKRNKNTITSKNPTDTVGT